MDVGSASGAVARKTKPKLQARPSIAPVTPAADSAISVITSPRLIRPVGLYLRGGKRAVDILISAVFLLTIGIWLLPLIALLIRIDSGGPALFRQNRVGRMGAVFGCIKFRTMLHDPEAGFAQATPDDPRVTRLGRFLRKTNLDELPQFINVLRGDMSLVGPRPHVPELDELFAHKVPGYRQRINVRPGVTGLAQISGARGETRSVQEMAFRVGLDLRYLKRCSVLMDFKIMVRTVGCLLKGDEKAY